MYPRLICGFPGDLRNVTNMQIKNSFPLPLRGEFVGGGKWKLLEPFQYHSKKYGTTKVPAGFISDGASFPAFAYGIMGSPWGGKYAEPSVIHDWDYNQKTPQKIADKKFLEGMKVKKVFFIKRDIMYRTLRMFGWFSWRKNKTTKGERHV